MFATLYAEIMGLLTHNYARSLFLLLLFHNIIFY